MNYGFTRASNFQKGTSSYEYALLRNEAIRNEQRSFAGTESLSTYIFDDYDLWKFKNNRDYTPVEVDAKTNLRPKNGSSSRSNPHFTMPTATCIRRCSTAMPLRCRSTSTWRAAHSA